MNYLLFVAGSNVLSAIVTRRSIRVLRRNVPLEGRRGGVGIHGFVPFLIIRRDEKHVTIILSRSPRDVTRLWLEKPRRRFSWFLTPPQPRIVPRPLLVVAPTNCCCLMSMTPSNPPIGWRYDLPGCRFSLVIRLSAVAQSTSPVMLELLYRLRKEVTVGEAQVLKRLQVSWPLTALPPN